MKKLALMLLVLVFCTWITSGCDGSTANGGIVGTYLLQRDDSISLKLDKNGSFSLNGLDESYSGKWQITDTERFLLNFTEGEDDYDWSGYYDIDSLDMDSVGAIHFLGYSYRSGAWFDKK